MDIWHGLIEFDDGQSQIQDLHFSHPDVSLPLLGQHTSLSFLAIVDTVNVPLYLAAGPSLDVWTDDESTEQWLHECLFGGLKDDQADQSIQWRDGVLLGVHRCSDIEEGPTPAITEVLLYAAAASSTPQDVHAPPTPPASSSPGPDGQELGTSLDIRIYALPLSPRIYETLEQAPSVLQFDPDPPDQDFYYLPSPTKAIPHHEDEDSISEGCLNAKRPKIESLFEDARQKRRLHKKCGGEGMAKAMAAMDYRMSLPAVSSSSSSGLPPHILDPNQPQKNTVPTARSRLSRASTTGCINLPPLTDPSNPRPQTSYCPTLSKGPRSSLHRAGSILPPSLDTRSSEIPEDSNNAIEQQNKTTLSRIIMAGMRMYGFQQQPRKKSISALDMESQAAAVGAPAEQDEYKAIYHQTFKAAVFTFRNCWTMRSVSQEVMRDTVDVFLARFCGDSFTKEGFGSGVLDTDNGDGFRRQQNDEVEKVGGISDTLGNGVGVGIMTTDG
ncbi:MAG: hypothetical protein Q9178_006603 [Gyalolechia marmorata]